MKSVKVQFESFSIKAKIWVENWFREIILCSNFLKGGIYREQIITEMYDIAADNDSEEDRSHPVPELPYWHHES